MSVVSILMPMRNAEDYVEETIQSLLDQTFADFELIVVDDCSTDDSLSLVKSFSDKRIKILQGKAEGISAALNLALDSAQGQYVCRCDADDLYPAERLKLQVEWLDAHPNYIALSGKFSSMDEKSCVISEFKTGESSCNITEELLNGVTRTTLCAFLIRTSALVQLNGFRKYFVTAEDIDMQLRLAETGAVGYIPENMYFYRIHDSSITHVQSLNQRGFYESLAREFLGQRLQTGCDLLQKGAPPIPPRSDKKPTNSKEQIIGYMIGESWGLHTNKQKRKAIELGYRACAKAPFNWRVWKNIIMLVVRR